MASPAVRSSVITRGTTASATPGVSLPATIRAGDTIFVVFRVAVAGAIGWPDATWTELFDASPDASDDQWAGAWKKADGTEGGSTITLSCTSGRFVACAWAIQDAADPTVRAPELSTVATGSATQPDATTCTPTGGSKDYLWLTFYGMEGEQTGITTYPTNYTLGQIFADCGTAGAVTTNCTMAGAARQATASSENAGAWTVAGTLDDWSAYTIAFHPATAVDAPLDREAEEVASLPKLQVKPSHGLAALTIAVNLLQSTLTPPDAPFVPVDYPNPPVPLRLVVTLGTRPTDDAAVAFTQLDWPTPTLRVRRALPVDPPNLLENTLAPASDTPFPAGEWLIPRRGRPPTLTWTQDRPFYAEDQYPVGRTTAPDRIPALRPAALGWTSPRPTFFDEPVAFSQTDWPLPGPRRSTRAIDPANASLPTPEVTTPGIPVDWPNPLRTRGTALTWIQARPQYYEDQTPVGQTSTPDRVAPLRQPTQTWIQARPTYYQDDYPSGRTVAPEAIAALRRPTLTWTIDRPQYYTDTGIPASGEWALPRTRLRLLAGVDGSLLTTTLAPAEGLPPGGSVLDLAPRRPLAAAASWTQDRKSYYADTYPTVQSDWPLPSVGRTLRLSTTATILPGTTPVVVTGVFQDKFTLGTKESLSSTGQPTLGGSWSW